MTDKPKEKPEKLEDWDDLFKFNKEILEDDWNDGSQLVFKNKIKGDNNVSNLLVGLIIFSIGIEYENQGCSS